MRKLSVLLAALLCAAALAMPVCADAISPVEYFFTETKWYYGLIAVAFLAASIVLYKLLHRRNR